jgi:hypothetical protein
VIDADGGAGGTGVTSSDYGAGGGGGSGGAIYLKGQVVEQSGSVHAAGGGGGAGSGNYSNGGSGGVGRIRVDAETLMINGVEVGIPDFRQKTNPPVGYFSSLDPNVPSGAVAYYKFDEGSGTVANDSVFGSNGTISGASWTALVIPRYALSFDGVDDYVMVPDLVLTSGSVEMWIRPSTVSGNRRIFSQLSGSSSQAGATGIDVYNNGPGSVWVWSGSTWLRLADNNTLAPNNWYHLVFLYSGSQATLFVNGVQKYTVNAGFNFSGVQMGIGARFLSSSGNTFYGFIDEVVIYNDVLSPEEIAVRYSLYTP